MEKLGMMFPGIFLRGTFTRGRCDSRKKVDDLSKELKQDGIVSCCNKTPISAARALHTARRTPGQAIVVDPCVFSQEEYTRTMVVG